MKTRIVIDEVSITLVLSRGLVDEIMPRDNEVINSSP
jgi:hypothetical protein